ncbi:hypothetical protein ACLOJK_018579 [Asimina triloba]
MSLMSTGMGEAAGMMGLERASADGGRGDGWDDEFCSWDDGSSTVRLLPSAAAGSAAGGVVGAKAWSSTDGNGLWT